MPWTPAFAGVTVMRGKGVELRDERRLVFETAQVQEDAAGFNAADNWDRQRPQVARERLARERRDAEAFAARYGLEFVDMTHFRSDIDLFRRIPFELMLRYSFSDLTKAQGWGAMDPAVWQEQISLYSQLGQFTAQTPKLDDVITLDILKATAAARTKA